MFTAFNLRRLMNIIDKNAFKKFLAGLASTYFAKTALLKPFSALLFIPTFSFAFYLSPKSSRISL
jgi:hypothetical protein